MNINGLFFPFRILTPNGLGAFGQGALSDGIIEGGAVTVSGGTATIANAWLIAGGRPISIGSGSFSVSGGNYTVIYAKVDTSKISTETTFTQAEIGTVSVSDLASALAIMNGSNASYPQGTINMSGGVYVAWLALISYTGGSGAVMAVNRARAAKAGQMIWENAAPGSAFAAQTLTLPQTAGYNSFLVVCRRNTTSELQTSMLCPVPGTSETSFAISSSEVGSSTTHRQRNVYITRSAGTVRFSAGWMSGSNSDNNYVLVPLAIYGVSLDMSVT